MVRVGIARRGSDMSDSEKDYGRVELEFRVHEWRREIKL